MKQIAQVGNKVGRGHVQEDYPAVRHTLRGSWRKVISEQMWLMVLTAFPPKQGRAHKYSLLNQQEKQKQLTYDGHEGVEVADVEALASHVDEELDDPSSVLLFHGLCNKQAPKLKNAAAIRIDCCGTSPPAQGSESENSDAHHADFRSHQVAESVEPLHVGLQVARLLVVAVAALKTNSETHFFSPQHNF